jgi:hypothetical protein
MTASQGDLAFTKIFQLEGFIRSCFVTIPSQRAVGVGAKIFAMAAFKRNFTKVIILKSDYFPSLRHLAINLGSTVSLSADVKAI